MKKFFWVWMVGALAVSVSQAESKKTIRVELKKSEVEVMKKNVLQILETAHFEPHHDIEGKQDGLTIRDLKKNSDLSKLGFKAGDIILQEQPEREALPILGIFHDQNYKVVIRRAGELYTIKTVFLD